MLILQWYEMMSVVVVGHVCLTNQERLYLYLSMSRMGNQSQWCPTRNDNAGLSISHKSQINDIFKRYRAKHKIGSIHNKPHITLTISQIKSVLYHPFSSQSNTEQHTQTAKYINTLSQLWLQQLDQIYSSSSQFFKPPFLQYYKAWIVSARVLTTVGDYIEKLTNKTSKLSPTQKAIGQYLSKNNLRFVFGRQLLQKKKYQFSNYSNYSKQSYRSQEIQAEEKESRNQLQLFYQQCKLNKWDVLVQLLQLLNAIDMITLESELKNKMIKNSFMNSLENIKREQQKSIFIKNYRFIKLKIIEQNNNRHDLVQILQEELPNYMFYKNEYKIRKGMQLQHLHQKFEDYQFLQHTHDYIQWMFPNHYSSSFNSKSCLLNYIQSELFYQDEEIRISLLHSIVMFFDFMGLRLDQNHKLIIQQKIRLKDVILRCHHNHLRIMRILACLSVTGFREIAIQLINFLDRHTKGKILAQQRREFQRNWQIYGDFQVQRAKEMCFLQKQDFPATHQFWKEITPQIPCYFEKRSWASTNHYSQYDYRQPFDVEVKVEKVENKSSGLELQAVSKQEKAEGEIPTQEAPPKKQALKVEEIKGQGDLSIEQGSPQQKPELDQQI